MYAIVCNAGHPTRQAAPRPVINLEHRYLFLKEHRTRESCPMKRLIICVTLGLVLSVALVTMYAVLKRRTSALEWFVDAQALWNDDTLFIAVQKGVAVQRTNWLLRKLSGASGIVFPKPRRLPDDVIVFRIESGKAVRFEHRQVGRFGGLMPYKGETYLSRGSNPDGYPSYHRLVGTNLVRVAREEAVEMRNSYKLHSDLVKREGWQHADLNFTEGTRDYSVEQKRGKMKIVLSEPRAGGFRKIELVNEVSKVTQVLCEFSRRPRDLNEAELGIYEQKTKSQ
jgi:hypothetical protein